MAKQDGNTAPVAQSTALALRPADVPQAVAMAEMLAKSDLVPGPYRNKAANVMLAIVAGSEMGLGAAQALRAMHIVDGKPVLAADAMGALVMGRRDICQYLTVSHSDDERAEYVTQRVGSPEPVRMGYTRAQAERAGLWGKSTWAKHPSAMLRARALAAICRAVYPDLVLGVYETDEGDEIQGRRDPRADAILAQNPPRKPSELPEEPVHEAEIVEFPKPVEAPKPVIKKARTNGTLWLENWREFPDLVARGRDAGKAIRSLSDIELRQKAEQVADVISANNYERTAKAYGITDGELKALDDSMLHALRSEITARTRKAPVELEPGEVDLFPDTEVEL